MDAPPTGEPAQGAAGVAGFPGFTFAGLAWADKLVDWEIDYYAKHGVPVPKVILDGPIRHATRECERYFNEWLAKQKVDERTLNIAIASAPVAGIAAVEVYERVKKGQAAKKAPDFRPDPEPAKEKPKAPTAPAPPAPANAPRLAAPEPDPPDDGPRGNVNGPGRDRFAA